MIDPIPIANPAPQSFFAELQQTWRQLPFKALFFSLLGLWLGVFHLLGSSTLGYVHNPSLFVWMNWMYERSEDDRHGRLIPFVVLALFWWKRRLLLDLPKQHWWPAFPVLFFGVGLHVVGYVLQQTQISVVGFFVGLYGLTGLVWGRPWMVHTFFPVCLFMFCLPLSNVGVGLTLPLRILATDITSFVCRDVLGINVIQDGTRMYDPQGAYRYEVAAACSGLRSLTATLALAMIYAFMVLRRPWKRAVMLLAAFPLSVAANVVRLTTIVTTAEAFGQKAGNFVHSNSILSLLPYVPALLGIFLLGHFLKRDASVTLTPDLALSAKVK